MTCLLHSSLYLKAPYNDKNIKHNILHNKIDIIYWIQNIKKILKNSNNLNFNYYIQMEKIIHI